MRRSTFILALVVFSILAILAIAHYLPASRQDVSPGASAVPTVTPDVPAATAMLQPDLNLSPDLTMPEMSPIMFNFPRIFDHRIDAVLPTIRPTPTPTPAQPCPTPMQPMKPMDPWKPMAAMTPMVA